MHPCARLVLKHLRLWYTDNANCMARGCHDSRVVLWCCPATVDRLVHHSTILEMNVGSYRRNKGLARRVIPRAEHLQNGSSSGVALDFLRDCSRFLMRDFAAS
jgi:hypothetical protein